MRPVDPVPAAFLRPSVRAALVVATLTVVAGTAIWVHERYTATPAPRVPVSVIVQTRARWLGKRVQVNGGLVRFSDPRSGVYGVVDDEGFRIGIRHLHDWTALVGHAVVVVGTVEFDPNFGLYLARPEVHAAGPSH